MPASFDTPVVFWIFKRPETTEKVFAAIAQARPKNLFVFAEGPRPDHPEDQALCAQARAIVKVDWPCNFQYDYAPKHMGGKVRFATAMKWIFSQVDRAIILEDDCVPDPSFFPFCAELLEKYKDDTRIGMITGFNAQLGRSRTKDSYFFSTYHFCWGWATWRRTWQCFDEDLGTFEKQWPQVRDAGWIKTRFRRKASQAQWSVLFEDLYRLGGKNITDGYWTFTALTRNLLTIIPNQNLISNIGWGKTATHTKLTDRYAYLPTIPMQFPLRHPGKIAVNTKADDFVERILFSPSLLRKRWNRILSILVHGFSALMVLGPKRKQQAE